jgi:outer membrane murein-binding lipoprotein Lpp
MRTLFIALLLLGCGSDGKEDVLASKAKNLSECAAFSSSEIDQMTASLSDDPDAAIDDAYKSYTQADSPEAADRLYGQVLCMQAMVNKD